MTPHEEKFPTIPSFLTIPLWNNVSDITNKLYILHLVLHEIMKCAKFETSSRWNVLNILCCNSYVNVDRSLTLIVIWGQRVGGGVLIISRRQSSHSCNIENVKFCVPSSLVLARYWLTNTSSTLVWLCSSLVPLWLCLQSTSSSTVTVKLVNILIMFQLPWP